MNPLVIKFCWDNLEFSCFIQPATMLNYLRLNYYEDNELTRNIVCAEFTRTVYDYLVESLPELSLVTSSLLVDNVPEPSGLYILCNKHMFLGNKILVVADEQDTLLKIEQQLFLSQESVRLPEASCFKGNATINLFEQEYLVSGLEYQTYIDPSINIDYLRLQLTIADKQVILYVSTNIIPHFSNTLFGSSNYSFIQESNIIFMVLDMAVNHLNLKYNLQIIVHDFAIIKLDQLEKYHQLTFRHTNSGFIWNIFVKRAQIIKYEQDLNKLFTFDVTSESDLVVDVDVRLAFPIYIAETSSNFHDINLLKPGEVILLEKSYGNGLGLNGETSLLDLGQEQIIMETINSNSIRVIDKFYG